MQRTRIIKFLPSPALVASTEAVLEPKPAAGQVPEWYRNSDVYTETSSGGQVSGLKTCVPFLDGLLSGYFIPTQAAMYVSRNPDGTRRIEWDGNFPIVKEREVDTASSAPRPSEHLRNHLIWNCPWGIKTPKGFSTLWTHPLNRHDLPFVTASAIVDTDRFHSWGNVPFFLRDDFEGEIPAGTPIAQVFPIKREQWASVYDPWTNFQGSQQGAKARSVERGWYRDFVWIKKVFK